MNQHLKNCLRAVKGTCNNRKVKLQKAYSEKEGRVATSLGTLKTAAAVIGYGLYAGMPTGLRDYETYDSLDNGLDRGALPED